MQILHADDDIVDIDGKLLHSLKRAQAASLHMQMLLNSGNLPPISSNAELSKPSNSLKASTGTAHSKAFPHTKRRETDH